MKLLLVLLGAALVVTAPFSSFAAPAPSVDGGRSGNWLVRTEVIGQGANRAVYYYTNVVLTGSHIPVVLRRYRGQIEIVSGTSINGRAYLSGELANAGAIDAGSALARIDPAISTR